MIDWVTAVLPCHHDKAVCGDRIVKVSKDGEIAWQTEHRFEVKGSHETNIFVLGLLTVSEMPRDETARCLTAANDTLPIPTMTKQRTSPQLLAKREK